MIRDLPDYADDFAHIAFKRVCGYRGGPWKTRWLYDAVATRAAGHLLLQAETSALIGATGDQVQEFIDKQEYLANYWSKAINVAKVLKPHFLLPAKRLGSPEYDAAVNIVGQRLEHILGWTGICQIGHCPSYKEWKDSLTEDKRRLLRTLIGHYWI